MSDVIYHGNEKRDERKEIRGEEEMNVKEQKMSKMRKERGRRDRKERYRDIKRKRR